MLFGKDDKYESMMQSLTSELCTVAINNISAAANISDHTDLLESLFTLLSQIIKKVPKLLACVDSVSLIQCGEEGSYSFIGFSYFLEGSQPD